MAFARLQVLLAITVCGGLLLPSKSSAAPQSSQQELRQEAERWTTQALKLATATDPAVSGEAYDSALLVLITLEVALGHHKSAERLASTFQSEAEKYKGAQATILAEARAGHAAIALQGTNELAA